MALVFKNSFPFCNSYFETLTGLDLYSVFEDSYGCVRSKVIATQTVPGTIYEVRGQQVHGQSKYVSNMHKFWDT